MNMLQWLFRGAKAWTARFLAFLAGSLVYLARPHIERHEPAFCDAESRGRNFLQLAIIATVMILITGFIVAALWASLFFYPRELVLARVPAEPLIGTSQLGAMPRLDDDTAEFLDELRESHIETLNSYGWVDRERGVVRIPIERAMELLSSRE